MNLAENTDSTFLYSFVDMSNSYIPDFKSSFVYRTRYDSPVAGLSGIKDMTFPLYTVIGIVFFIGGAAETRYKKRSPTFSNSSYSIFIHDV